MLSIRDLCGGYGQLEVLRGVSLNVAAGEIVSLLGMNGAGKTTTLRTISGVLPTWSGAVEFNGRVFKRENPETRAGLGIGHVPEGRGILRSLTVAGNLELGATLRRDPRSVVMKDREDLLDLFPALRPKLEDSAASLSGGQQQMLAIARGLLARPKLLMIDELSFGLAPALVDQLFQVIRKLREDGTTFLLVEQHSGVLDISDRTYILAGGRTVLETASSELKKGSEGGELLARAYLGESAPTAPDATRQ